MSILNISEDILRGPEYQVLTELYIKYSAETKGFRFVKKGVGSISGINTLDVNPKRVGPSI